MLNAKQTDRLLRKMVDFEKIAEKRVFVKVGETSGFSAYEGNFGAEARPHELPDKALFKPVDKGFKWGGEWGYCWLSTSVTVPEGANGKELFLLPHSDAFEIMLWVDGTPFGIFTTARNITEHGNHYSGLIAPCAKAGDVIDVVLECYAGHYTPGCNPLDDLPQGDYTRSFNGADLCVKDKAAADFFFDLKTVNQLARVLNDRSEVRAAAVNILTSAYAVLERAPEKLGTPVFNAAIAEAAQILKGIYAFKNGSLAPEIGVIGHSHMDTAWQWPISETIKKCARTYSNQLSLMEQYPEYMFVQSSAYHSHVIKEHYPKLFEGIKKRVAEGRYEPNGGVWVECDCNITGGEAMIRQFVWGQRFTRENFGYTADCFWLPDTFGYSAAIPQIMAGCSVNYFLTTKMSWNDTNTFPYETFWWEGLDGTRVLTHLNRSHLWPDPETCVTAIEGRGGDIGVYDKRASNARLMAYGFGDGGGGPQFEMIEMAQRVKDIQGIARVNYTTVSGFMKNLEKNINDAPVYSGELYLELHRGTLTNKHEIKRNNRLAEVALHDAELMTVIAALKNGYAPDVSATNELLGVLLVRQFHDILPGTCISCVHDEAIKAVDGTIKAANALFLSKMSEYCGKDNNFVTVFNPAPFVRNDVALIESERAVKGFKTQSFVTWDGTKTAVAGASIPAFGFKSFELTDEKLNAKSGAFSYSGNRLETPFYTIIFNEKMFMESLYDKEARREIRGKGYALGTLAFGEDMPMYWDNWDIDADFEMKSADSSILCSSEVVSDGDIVFQFLNKYRLSEKTTVEQIVTFFTDSREVRYDVKMDWYDNHALLKACFDTTARAGFARCETQFGCVTRPTTRNNDLEKAKFEVSVHKYADISEPRYGVAVLNDCKYGAGIFGGQIRLSLHKGGTHPDASGDSGTHYCSYALLPHVGGFSSENVIRPAYAFNLKTRALNGFKADSGSFIETDAPNVITETVKPCEDTQNAFIVRLYEAEGSHAQCSISFAKPVKSAALCNMLEEELPTETFSGNTLNISFKPFEIKTIKCCF